MKQFNTIPPTDGLSFIKFNYEMLCVFTTAVTLLSSLNVWSYGQVSGRLSCSTNPQSHKNNYLFLLISILRKSCTTTVMMGSTAV